MDSDFPVALLAQITPTDIVRYLRLKAYGDPDPDPDSHPVIGRANSISYNKKALLYFMMTKSTAWNEVTLHGNPTRSAMVTQLIKEIKRAEVRKLGKKTNAQRNGCSKDDVDARGRWRQHQSSISGCKGCINHIMHWWTMQVCSQERK